MYTRETLKAPFPADIKKLLTREGYRKREVIVTTESCTPRTLRSYWSEGAKDYYTVYGKDGNIKNVPINGSAFDPPRGQYTPEDGDIMVRTGLFRGKASVATITFFWK